MKYSLTSLFLYVYLGLLILPACQTKIEDVIEFDSQELFHALCAQGVDRNNDGYITSDEAEKVRRLDFVMTGIRDLRELEVFVNLDSLLMKLEDITEPDFSSVPGISYLECTMGSHSLIDLTGNLFLEEVILEKNQIDSLFLPENAGLKVLRCGYNRLGKLDVSRNPGLLVLTCNNNFLTSLDLSNNRELTRMISCANQLRCLDVSVNSRISTLGIDNMPSLEKVLVWTLPFPPDTVSVWMGYSPNVEFIMDSSPCSDMFKVVPVPLP